MFAPINYSDSVKHQSKSYWTLSQEGDHGVVEVSLKKVNAEQEWTDITK